MLELGEKEQILDFMGENSHLSFAKIGLIFSERFNVKINKVFISRLVKKKKETEKAALTGNGISFDTHLHTPH